MSSTSRVAESNEQIKSSHYATIDVGHQSEMLALPRLNCVAVAVNYSAPLSSVEWVDSTPKRKVLLLLLLYPDEVD